MPPITSFFAPKLRKTDSQQAESRAGDVERNSNGKRGPGEDDSSTKRHKDESVGSSFFGPRVSTVADDNPLSPETMELVSHLHTTSDESVTWRKKLHKHISSPGFAKLAKFVANARKKDTVYPPPSDTFSALNLTPLDKVKVVIVGQDPYHGPNQGHGLCFSVREGIMVPPSLKNIYKELAQDDNVEFPSGNRGMPNHGCLERWAKQGVLLLNSVLTVKRSEANSHKNQGWELFTDEVIRTLDRESRSAGKGLVFLLWGKPASKKAQSIVGGGNKKHTIICTSHPSPLGATKTNAPFLGSKCFSRCNAALEKMGHEPIDWNVDGDL